MVAVTRQRIGGWVALGFAGLVAAAAAVWLMSDETDTTSDAGVISPADTRAPGTGPLEDRHPEVGKIAPDFALLDAADGKTIRKLSDYRGKTVVLNWYATWCGPCQAEIPDFESAYQKLGGASGPVVFLGVNLQESREDATNMLRTLGATFPSLLDRDGSVAEQYRVAGMPTTFFIDKDGIIQNSGSGRVTEQTLAKELARLGHTY